MKETIGFIGQGWIGKHYADDFENRGYKTIRYALEEEYLQNKELIKDCRITFVAVPTPTTPDGFDSSILENSLAVVGKGSVAVIKSTTIPGLIVQLQEKFPEIFVLHSPEFLVEKTAAHDAANPNRNIIGVPEDNDEYRKIAQEVIDVLPIAPYNRVMSSKESELVKYAGNCFLYTKVLYMNMLYDVVEKSGGEWPVVREAMINDPRIGESHTEPLHDSGRGAGGHCLIKDFEAFRIFHNSNNRDSNASILLEKMINYNNYLLQNSSKNIDILEGVYGKDILNKSNE